MSKQYWPPSHTVNNSGCLMEVRSSLAWTLLERFGLVAGHSTREDQSKRAVLDLMPTADVVKRAFDLADAFMDEAERRGELRPCTDEDAKKAFAFGGELQRIQNDAQYPKSAALAKELAE